MEASDVLEVTDADWKAALLVGRCGYVRPGPARALSDQSLLVQAFAAHRIAALEEAAGVMARRAAMYRAKASKRDPFADDDRNAYDTFVMCAEASEYGEADIRALKEKNDG